MSESKITEGLGSRLAEFLGVETTASPRFMMITFANDDVQKFTMDTSATAKNVVALVEGVLSGEVKAFLKSAEIPEDNSAPVKVLVGKNWDSIVNKPDQWVFVELYAPWCGHCKSLEPIWDELAQVVASKTDLVIAKMDSTANEVAGVSVKSFPTIRLFRVGSAPIEYEGDRTLDGFKKFITEKTGMKFDTANTETNEDL